MSVAENTEVKPPIPRDERGLFLPGTPPGPGRGKGQKERPWLKPDYWHDLIIAEWEHLKAYERASIAMKGFGTTMPKNVGPQSVEESVENAEAAMKMLRMLQEVSRGANGSTAGPEACASSHTNGVENGAVVIQVVTPPTPGV